jgi:uncharacterized protein (DUF342 family)
VAPGMDEENQASSEPDNNNSYIAVTLSYDNNTRILNAQLDESDIEAQESFSSIKQKLDNEEFKGIAVSNKVIDGLLQKIDAKATGIFELVKKPEFTNLSLELDEEKSELNAVLTLAEDDQKIKLMNINSLIEEGGYKEFRFEDNALKNLLEKIHKNERGKFLIAKKLDAKADIKISKNKMSATISITPAFGGNPLLMIDLLNSLEQEKISIERCDQQLLETIIEAQKAEDIPFAHGIEPINGEDAKFEAMVDSIIESGPHIDENDKAHFREIKQFTIVDAGKPLMRRTPATLGTKGINIFGEPIEPTPGKDTPFSKESEGAIVSPDDSNLLIADTKGSPIVLPTGVKIDDVIKFHDIDLATGNVRVDSSVVIEGSVKQGMLVIATGSVIINGSVCNGTVTSGENIHVGEGIIGSKITEDDDGTQATARLTAKGNIYAKYVTLAKLCADKDVIINEYVTTSDIEAGGNVIVGHEGGKGQIIGGRTNATDGININISGANSSVTTKLTVGLPLELKAKLKACVAHKESIEKDIKQLEFRVSQNKPEKDQSESGKEDRLRLKKLQMELARTIKNMDEINDELLNMCNSKITIKNKIHENTVLNINSVKQVFYEERNGEFTFVRKGQKIEPL